MSDMVGTQYVTPVKDGWVVRASGQEGSSKIFSKRNEAIKYAREIAKKHNVSFDNPLNTQFYQISRKYSC